MMFLTDAEFRPPLAEAPAALRRDAADLGHRRVWSLFANPTAGDTAATAGAGRVERERPFLYRADEVGRYLILCVREPNEAEHWSLKVKPFAPAFSAGQALRFRLRANPSRTLPRGAGPDAGKHVDAVMHAKRRANPAEFGPDDVQEVALEWLFARGSHLGLAFEEEACLALEYRQHRAAYKSGQPPIRFSSVDYQGVAIVTDPERLASTIRDGVGRARAFGCGLLLVRPA